MTYRPIVASSPPPKHVARLIWKLERHYLQPAHALFRLPIPHYGVVGEFQFGIAHLLLAAIAGMSTTLYSQSGSNGERFRQVLINYYPFAYSTPFRSRIPRQFDHQFQRNSISDSTAIRSVIPRQIDR